MKKYLYKVSHLLGLSIICLAYSDGVGTRGTGSLLRPQTEVTSIQINKSIPLPMQHIFKANGAFIKNAFNIYVSKQQLAFEKGEELKTLSPNTISEWVSIRAGTLIARLEETNWKTTHNNDTSKNSVEYFFPAENMIEIEASTSSFEAPLNSEDLTEALSHFLLSAGAPFSYETIYGDLAPSIQELSR